MSFFFGQDIRLTVYLAINDQNIDFLKQNISRIASSDEIKKEDWTVYAIYNGNLEIIDFFYNILEYLPEKEDDDYVICKVAYCIGEDKIDSEKFEHVFYYLLEKYNNIPRELFENISKGEYDPIVTNILDYKNHLLIKG